MSNCNTDNNCESTSGPTFPDEKNNPSLNGCDPSFPYPSTQNCSPFQLSNDSNTIIDQYVSEHINIGGAILNIYKLLGIHEQGKLVDVTGKGEPISGGYVGQYIPDNAFDIYQTEWRSAQKGVGVVQSSYIGYDFGEIKLKDQSRNMYGIETKVYKHITAVKIKQSSNIANRITKARIERSNDGEKWFGSSIIDLPNDNCLNLIKFKSSAPARYWRIRPVEFNGGVGDYWGVVALQMFHDYEATQLGNIQDKIFFENRDRDYNTDPIVVKGVYELVETSTELTKFGIDLPTQMYYFDVSFTTCIEQLERPIVIGDIIELPSETQYDPNLNPIKKWLEVTDVSWSTKGYTPGWKPTLLKIVTQPAMVSQETQDLFGDLADVYSPDNSGLVINNDGLNKIYQDFFDITQTINAEAHKAVTEQGGEASSVFREWEQNEIDNAATQGLHTLSQIGMNDINQGKTAVKKYVEDAIPSNNAPYTEGISFPTSPKNGDYHRLTYEGLSKDVPARLHRWSTSKGRWIYLETDRRFEFNSPKKTIEEFLKSGGRVPDDDATNIKETK